MLPWYEKNKRDLPWRRDREPYHVWLSEIMLQQTRAETVKAYYLRFLERLPAAADLAVCPDDELNKLWEGLGYYSRARNLKKAAQIVVRQYGGHFPKDYASVRALPGIGDYTAGAVCSICFEQKTPAVDGNVLRVWSRLCASYEDILKPETKRAAAEALAAVYPEGRCGDFTQALMELGASVCRPNGEPDCAACPLRGICRAAAEGLWAELPVRAKKRPRREEERTVFLLECGGKYAILKRPAEGLLSGLWEFPNVEGKRTLEEALVQTEAWGCRPRMVQKSVERIHIFTHITWEMTGYAIACEARPNCFVWADEAELRAKYSLPTAFRKFCDFRPEENGD
ncbi:MAG TPA: A/G-specific adenine glycosylase [Oscillospiraceae bacterium]|nr:A/G-specific adenine glycosylase [Oscillospiraceae bacterium]